MERRSLSLACSQSQLLLAAAACLPPLSFSTAWLLLPIYDADHFTSLLDACFLLLRFGMFGLVRLLSSFMVAGSLPAPTLLTTLSIF
jgi:hypothetical protein